jgi:hypothetical protein
MLNVKSAIFITIIYNYAIYRGKRIILLNNVVLSNQKAKSHGTSFLPPKIQIAAASAM